MFLILWSKFMYNNTLSFPLWKTQMIWQRKLNNILSEFNFSYSQYLILIAINFWNENKMKANQIEMIKFTNLDKMTMSKAITKLVKEGYIKQVPDKTDRRSKELILNKNAYYIISKVAGEIDCLEEEFFKKIPKAAQQIIENNLNIVLKDNLK